MARPYKQKLVPPEHNGICCGNCGQDPIRGHRYKCINCADFDLCHSCEELLVHNEDHIFLKIRVPTPNTNLHFIPSPFNVESSQVEYPITASTESKLPCRDASIPSHEVVDMVNQFGFELQWLWGSSTQEASAISAFNIYNCLTMVAAGSEGQSLEACKKKLFGGHSDIHPLIHQAIQLDDYSKIKTSSTTELTSSNSIWHDPAFDIGADWSNTMKTAFKAKFGPMNAGDINRWVKEQTKGRITKVVSQAQTSQSDLILIACLYFKAQWLEPFPEARTSRSTFHGSKSQQYPCQMMNRRGDMPYHEDDQLQICMLPYRDQLSGKQFSPKWHAAIILPKPTPPGSELLCLSNMLSHLSKSPTAFRSLLKPTGVLPAHTSVNLSLPRFKIRQTLDISRPLVDMGFSPLFKQSHDFRPMIPSAPACVSKVQHDIFIEVNEKGTEMAAATAGVMSCGIPSRPTKMRVDRPFLFLIFDAETTLVLCSAIVDSIPSTG